MSAVCSIHHFIQPMLLTGDRDWLKFISHLIYPHLGYYKKITNHFKKPAMLEIRLCKAPQAKTHEKTKVHCEDKTYANKKNI